MKAADREVEVKLRFSSTREARSRIEETGATVRDPRHFEDNILYEDAARSFKPSGRLLRVRRVDDRGTLTFKAKPRDDSRYKVREEIETPVADPAALARILERIGLSPVYRYQKYRTVFDGGDGLQVCLDETPLGCFVELEGTPAAIDAFATRIGCGVQDYIRSTYRELQEAAGGEHAGDMVFERDPGSR